MKLLLILLLISAIILPVGASEIMAPEVFESGRKLMPEASSFSEGLGMIMKDIIPLIMPEFYEASRVCLAMIAAVILTSVVAGFSDTVRITTEICASASISTSLMMNINSLIQLGTKTVSEMAEYGKLLVPVLTTALAAQGKPGKSAALYTGTVFAITWINTLINKVLVPGLYIYLTLSVTHGFCAEQIIKRIKDSIKGFILWILKTVLMLFVSYISISGVISGSTDAAALKITKTIISTAVPIVGGIMADASESVLVSVGLAKNAAGMYGVFAILVLFAEPFIKLLVQFILWKITCIVCSVVGSKRTTELIEDYSSAMLILLAMTGAMCILLLFSAVCFLKGVE